MMTAALALLLIPAFSGCKSAPPASNATTQNAAAPAGTASGTAAGTTAGSSSNAASGSTANPAPQQPVQVTLTVAAGKDVRVRINETINSKTANVGDPFSGELSSPLTTKSGETVFAKGSRVSGSVVAAKGQGRFKGAGILAIELKSVGGVPFRRPNMLSARRAKASAVRR
jgi:hypothetical protein